MRPLPGCVVLLLSLLVSTSSALAEDWPPGAVIEDAAVADITPEGFDAVAMVIPGFLPSQIDIPGVSQGGGELWGAYLYYFSLSGAWAGIQVTGADIEPGTGVLDITADALVNLNTEADPFELEYELLYTGTNDCPGYVDPFPVRIHTTMGLAVATGEDGRPIIDATVGAIDISYDLTNEDIHLDCFIQDIEDVLSYVGLSLYDLIIDQLDSVLAEQVSSLGPTIEQTLEEALAGASVSQELDLNGAVINIQLYPSDVNITPDGVRVSLAGGISGDAAECIEAYDPGGSLATPTPIPDIGSAPSGVDVPYHVGLNLSDDFANSAIYSLWRGGLLCFAMEEAGGLPLDSTILNLLTGDVFAEMFPTASPGFLRTVPRGVPTVSYDGAHDVQVDLKDLDLELFAELDGRMARMVAVSVAGPVGADLVLDGKTGNLAINLAIDGGELTPSVHYNEMYPEQNDAIETSFAEKFEGLLDTVIGGLLPETAFALPSFSGLGLQELQVAAAGTNGDWLGAYARVGAVTYGSSDGGCGGCGGDGKSSGCDSGCSTGGGIPTLAWALLPLGVATLLRRRE